LTYCGMGRKPSPRGNAEAATSEEQVLRKHAGHPESLFERHPIALL
jgi:hypothetical protein